MKWLSDLIAGLMLAVLSLLCVAGLVLALKLVAWALAL